MSKSDSLSDPSDPYVGLLLNAPPVHLLFDVGGVLVGKPREWQEFARVGQCFLPQVVFDEIKFLAQVGVDHPRKQTARAFMDFLSGSNWQLTSTSAPHPELLPPVGRTLGKRSRLALSMAEASYGLAKASTGRLVVLISNDQAALRRIQALNVVNLTGLPISALLIWCRTGRRPAVVMQHMQQMQERRRALTVVGKKPAIAPPPVFHRPTPKLALPNAYATLLHRMMSGVSAVLTLAIAIFVAWYAIHPHGFNQLLRQHDLPTLPEWPGSK